MEKLSLRNIDSPIFQGYGALKPTRLVKEFDIREIYIQKALVVKRGAEYTLIEDFAQAQAIREFVSPSIEGESLEAYLK